MSHTEKQIPAVPVGSADLNQGPTASPMGRGDVIQVLLPNMARTATHKARNNKDKVTELHLVTYNVRTLSDECHLVSLENEIEKIKWDIIGISEMRRPGENVVELASQHIMFNKGNDKKQGGVGFLIHKKLKGNIEEFHATSNRVASVTIRISKRYKIRIIQVYAPTSVSSREELEEFYDDLQTEMLKLNRGRLQFTSVLEEDGTLTTDRERIVERSREFYEKLYSSTRQEPPEADIEQQFEGFPNIKAWEVKSAVKQSKKGKAPGPDNITIDLIDAAGDIINDKLATLFNECLIQSKVPEIWNEAIIILLHKKGDKRNISNYRPISLLNNIYKLFTKIITNRITRTLDENQPREQAGFKRGFSTIDHLHAVNQLIEKCAEYKIPLVVGLVDYNKAFDSVKIPDVIEALQEQGVDPVYVNVLKHIYKQAKSFIRLHKDSKPFQVSRGVRQGDTSSPKLFTACLEKVFRKLNWSRRGILIDGEYLSHLRFADDIIIFTRNIAELHEMLQELNQASLEVGLSMNFKKTKIMRNKHAEDTNRKITIDSNEIEEVNHYIYLGQRISMETASKEQEIKRRITLGWQAFGRASAIFKNKEIPTCLKRQVYNQCIIPTVTYGSETWNLTKIQTMKL